MASEAVRYSTVSGVATLTMSQVATRNALTPELMAGIVSGLDRATADPGARVVVLTHDGPVFCAGADLRQGRASATVLPEVLAALQDCPRPVVARIAGACLGGGLGLATACDLSIASEEIRLGFSEVRLGVAPAIVSVVCLPKLRRGDALEAMLTGERMTAARAAEVGLITRAVPAGELDAAVAAVVVALRAGAPEALAATKRMIYASAGAAGGRDAAFAEMARLSERLFAGEEAAEGRDAFREKRPPAWAGPAGPGGRD